jgi:hypothetical protein
MKISRRSIARLVLGAPVAASLASAAQVAGFFAPRRAAAEEVTQPSPQPEEPPLAKFLARQEADLTAEERRRVRREVAQLEQSLKEVRDYPLGNDVPPSGTFRALKGRRRAR